VPIGDVEALALREVADDRSGAADRALRARRYVEKYHAWPRIAAQWEAVLNDAHDHGSAREHLSNPTP
jgi:hypothetical protein